MQKNRRNPYPDHSWDQKGHKVIPRGVQDNGSTILNHPNAPVYHEEVHKQDTAVQSRADPADVDPSAMQLPARKDDYEILRATKERGEFSTQERKQQPYHIPYPHRLPSLEPGKVTPPYLRGIGPGLNFRSISDYDPSLGGTLLSQPRGSQSGRKYVADRSIIPSAARGQETAQSSIPVGQAVPPRPVRTHSTSGRETTILSKPTGWQDHVNSGTDGYVDMSGTQSSTPTTTSGSRFQSPVKPHLNSHFHTCQGRRRTNPSIPVANTATLKTAAACRASKNTTVGDRHGSITGTQSVPATTKKTSSSLGSCTTSASYVQMPNVEHNMHKEVQVGQPSESAAYMKVQSAGSVRPAIRSSHSTHSSMAPYSSSPSVAKSLTWKMRTRRPESFKTFSLHSLSQMQEQEATQDDFLKEVPSRHRIRTPRENRENLRASMGCCQLLCYDFKKWWHRQKMKGIEIPIFRNQIKKIEAQFGSGIVSFFVFTRWLVMLNLLLGLLWLACVVLPQAVVFEYTQLQQYQFHMKNLLDGEQALSISWLFYGGYDAYCKKYPLFLAYFCLILITYFGSLFIIFRSVALAEKANRTDPKDTKYPFSMMVFTSWDHSVQSSEAVNNLTLGIANSFKDLIYEVKAEKHERSLSRKERLKLYARRALAWFLTLCFIGLGCGAIIYLASSDIATLLEKMGIHNPTGNHFLVIYGTPIAFTLINVVVPFAVYQLPKLENYVRGKDELNITVGRVFVLRIANIIALIMSLYQKVHKGNSTGCAGTVLGQELYRLVIVETVVQVVLQLVPPVLQLFWSKKKTEFAMAKIVLSLVYRQALIWAGTLVCPLLPLLGALSMVIVFVINYYVVRKTCIPPRKRWSQSRHSSFFMSLLAATLVILILMVSLIIGRNDIVNLGQTGDGSSACGPFGNSTITSAFSVFKTEITRGHQLAGQVLDFIFSSTVLMPGVFVMIAVIYFQKLNMSWQKETHRMVLAELENERDENKELLRRLHAQHYEEEKPGWD